MDWFRSGKAQSTRTSAPSSPNVTAIKLLIDKAANDSLQEPHWGVNMHLCDLVSSSKDRGEVLRCLVPKIQGSSKEQLYSLILLETLGKNVQGLWGDIISEGILVEVAKVAKGPLPSTRSKVALEHNLATPEHVACLGLLVLAMGRLWKYSKPGELLVNCNSGQSIGAHMRS